MRPSIPARAVLAAVTLLVAGPARALSTETTTLSGFQIGVRDLDLSDGIDPTLSLDPPSRSTVLPGVTSMGATTAWPQRGDSPFGAVAASGELDGSGGAASFSGDPFGAGATIVASAHGDGSTDIGTAGAFVVNPASANLLVLGPHSEVSFGGLATLAWDASNPGASAVGEVDLAFFTAPGSSVDVDIQPSVAGGYYGDGNGPLAGSVSLPILAVYDNDSDVPVTLAYYVGVFARASDLEMVLPPVDEPASAALLLAGAALAWRLRPRRCGVPTAEVAGARVTATSARGELARR